jgi:hypothetical protein
MNNIKKRIARLDSVGAVASELGRVYRQTRHGEIPAQDATRYASILTAVRQCLESSEVERRIQELEAVHRPPQLAASLSGLFGFLERR